MVFELSQIVAWLAKYKYFVLFPAVFFEGPISIIIAGYFSSLGILNPFIVYLVANVADDLADIFYYFLGFFGRKGLVEKWCCYFGMTPGAIKRLDEHFNRHAGKTLFWGKMTYGIVAAMLLVAGAAKVPFKKFIGYTTLATLFKTFILLLIGIYFGSAYLKIKEYLDYTAFVTVGIAILLLIGFVWGQKFARKYVEANRNNNP